MDYLLLAAALVILAGLFWLHRRVVIRAYAIGLDAGRQQGHVTGLGTAELHNYQAGYAQGHEDGLAEGRAKAEAEADIAANKNYRQGWNDAIEAVRSETYAVMAEEAAPQLSA